MTKSKDDCELLAARALAAYAAGEYGNLCLEGEPVFYYPHDEALVPGHIYSLAGMDEYKISKACEYHFDKWFKEEEEDEQPAF